MANTFTRKLSQNIGTSAIAVGSYTVAANTTVVVVGLTITNKTGSSIAANVYINDGAANTFVTANAPISSGSTLVAVGGDQKVVLLTGDQIFVQSSAASSLDAVLSILEIT
jgi:acetyltransferase-like isoleucine patch superfamily enzyme